MFSRNLMPSPGRLSAWPYMLLMLPFLPGCEKAVDPLPNPTFGTGVFIVNEGPFQTGSGTLSFYDRQTEEVRHDIYRTANDGATIGNIFQSMTIHGQAAYLVANNAGRLLVVDKTTLRQTGKLEQLDQPRYCLPVSDRYACLTQWGADGKSGELLWLDLPTLTIVDSLRTGNGPEQMWVLGNKLYVANSGGIGGVDSVITVVDLDTRQLIDQVVVGINPVSMAATADGALWVGCAGYTDWTDPGNPLNQPGRLVRLVDDQVDRSLPLETGAYDLTVTDDGRRLLFLGSNYGAPVYQLDLENSQGAVGTFLSGNYYAMAADPVSGRILVADAMDFQSVGRVHIFDLAGNEQGTFDAGIIPGGFAFQ